MQKRKNLKYAVLVKNLLRTTQRFLRNVQIFKENVDIYFLNFFHMNLYLIDFIYIFYFAQYMHDIKQTRITNTCKHYRKKKKTLNFL